MRRKIIGFGAVIVVLVAAVGIVIVLGAGR